MYAFIMTKSPKKSLWSRLNLLTSSHREQLLFERIEIAKRQQTFCDELHDPIEDEPHIQPMIAEAAARAEAEVPDSGIGWCHSIWEAQQKILRDRFGIEWFTPSEMNPNVFYD